MNPDLKPMLAYALVGSLLAVVLSSAIRPASAPLPEPAPHAERPASIYDGYATPAAILRAHARVESDEMDWAIGDQGRSRGRMQINESFRAERVRKWGEYDPHKAEDAIRIASEIWQENAKAFAERPMRGHPETWARQREDLTIAAYRQGVAGVLRDGATMWYVERVRRAMRDAAP